MCGSKGRAVPRITLLAACLVSLGGAVFGVRTGAPAYRILIFVSALWLLCGLTLGGQLSIFTWTRQRRAAALTRRRAGIERLMLDVSSILALASAFVWIFY